MPLSRRQAGRRATPDGRTVESSSTAERPLAADDASQAAAVMRGGAMPRRGYAWWLAIRPKTLSVSVVPVLVGTSLAWSQQAAVLWLPALVALLAALLIQVGTNLHNDVADFERGADGPQRLGPPRATAMGWLAATAVRRGAWIAFALAFNLGVYLVHHGGWPIVVIGLASLAAGWAYSGGSRPIAGTAFGESFVLLFFGVVAVSGSYYLQTLSLAPAAVLAGAIVGLPAAAVITVNNTRDRESDARVGRRTLAVLCGRRAACGIYAGELLLPFVLLPWLAMLSDRGFWLALPSLALPLCLRQIARFRHAAGAAYNELLADTARLQLLFALLLAGGLLAGVP